MTQLWHHYIRKRIPELLIGNSKFLIQKLLNQILCDTDVNEHRLFVAEIGETLDLNN